MAWVAGLGNALELPSWFASEVLETLEQVRLLGIARVAKRPEVGMQLARQHPHAIGRHVVPHLTRGNAKWAHTLWTRARRESGMASGLLERHALATKRRRTDQDSDRKQSSVTPSCSWSFGTTSKSKTSACFRSWIRAVRSVCTSCMACSTALVGSFRVFVRQFPISALTTTWTDTDSGFATRTH